MLWLCNPEYIRAVVMPAVTEGRQRAGKALDGFDVVAAVPTALTDDPEAARATMRQDLIPYASLPFYRSMLERSGFGDEIAAFDEGMQAGDIERAKAGLSDRLLGALAGIGSGEEVQGRGRPLPGGGRDLTVHRGDPQHRLRRRAGGGRRADLATAPLRLAAPAPATPQPSAASRRVWCSPPYRRQTPQWRFERVRMWR